MKRLFPTVIGALLFIRCQGQTIPVELMTGTKRTGIDILWFRKIQESKSSQTPWLFFHRTRASVDWQNQTSFGVTNAVSYNFKNGIGLVAATQFLPGGFILKGGLQYFTGFQNGSLFSWAVVGENTVGNFSGDWFLLARWTPPFNQKTKWFLQGELLTQLDSRKNRNLVQRGRFGLSRQQWQYGLAVDGNGLGNERLAWTIHPGIFIRKEM